MVERRQISRLQMRMAIGRDGARHPIYQITIPIKIIKSIYAQKSQRFEFSYRPPNEIIAKRVRKDA